MADRDGVTATVFIFAVHSAVVIVVQPVTAGFITLLVAVAELALSVLKAVRVCAVRHAVAIVVSTICTLAFGSRSRPDRRNWSHPRLGRSDDLVRRLSRWNGRLGARCWRSLWRVRGVLSEGRSCESQEKSGEDEAKAEHEVHHLVGVRQEAVQRWETGAHGGRYWRRGVTGSEA